MNNVNFEDALIGGQINANDFCRYLSGRIADPLTPPPGAQAIYSWEHFEWFWCKLSDPKERAPGAWAIPRKFDISKEVTVDEGIVWGSGILEFCPIRTFPGGGCIKIMSNEQFERMQSICDQIHVHHKKVMTGLEKAGGNKNNFLYSDGDEFEQGNIAVNTLRQRRSWLLEVIQAHLNLIVTFRIALPNSQDTPNRKIMEAFLAGWIPVGYVGPLKTGSAVVFHPAIKGPP